MILQNCLCVSHSGISGRTIAGTLMALKFPGVSQQTQKYAKLSVPTSQDVNQRALTAQVSPHTHTRLHTLSHVYCTAWLSIVNHISHIMNCVVPKLLAHHNLQEF